MKYHPVNSLNVFLDCNNNPQKLGRLALANRRIYFEYAPEFIKTKIEISPFKLPLQIGAIPCENLVFEGLFGVFNDSLPDGWGRLLLDRQVRQNGIMPEQLTPLDRLAQVGKHGMGALVYEPYNSTHTLPEPINLDKLAQTSKAVLAGAPEALFDELLDLSGSSAGARPKIMVGISSNKKHFISGNNNLPNNYEHWMIKFASSNDPQDIGAIEYAYSLMAKAAGLEMMPTHLFISPQGAGYFGVQRFDRNQKQRVHIHTIAGLINADHRLPSLDYEQIMRATLALTHNIQELEKIFRLATFNVFAHNRDDHAKNFSFLMSAEGNWQCAPAYDLTFSNGPGGEHCTTIMGEGKNPTHAHLLKLAEKFGVFSAQKIIDEVISSINNWAEFADMAGVSDLSKNLVAKVICS